MKNKVLNTEETELLTLAHSEMELLISAACVSKQDLKFMIHEAVMNEASRIISYHKKLQEITKETDDDNIIEKAMVEFQSMVSAVTGCNHILTARTRHKESVYARALFIFLMRTQFNTRNNLCGLAKIGAMFTPRKDHATILHNYRRIVDCYCYDSIVRRDLDHIKNMCINMNRFISIVKQIEKLEQGYLEVQEMRGKNRS